MSSTSTSRADESIFHTPRSTLRQRNSEFSPAMAGGYASAEPMSPATTYSESSPLTGLRFGDSTRSSLQNIVSVATATPARRRQVRSDPALLTCFDPADQELYALWAPKR
ncbi:hypothetical protein BDN72DRAFT_831294 [Pluteus cervinus]|uniref:Uncharacterized protein n=1 Tax=Pluteus cervinus TaxID=181527 RepID=A0ACD3BE18_9AGAR|nr:hypothetical protein BDN72DRAFT_831294 [Pluteus cervinus]